MIAMKKIISLVMFLACSLAVFAQGDYLWPISGAKAGSNILSAPQSYVDGELNFDKLFIGARLGDVVVAPTDGTVTNISISYSPDLSSMYSYNYEKSFDHSLSKIRSESDKSMDLKYFSGMLGLSLGGGKMLYIDGLTGDRFFKTGQRIKRGDTLGCVGYSYRKIKEPSIRVSMSLNAKSADPMTSFGLKSSFISRAEIKPVVSLTKEQAKEDFLIYIGALKEAYPGLYNVLTAEELEQYVAGTVAAIDKRGGDLSYDDFRFLLNGAVAKIHDSHIEMYSTAWKRATMPPFVPQVYVGWFNDTLYCTLATNEYEHLIGRHVKAINGMSADSARKIVADNMVGYDSKVKQYIDLGLSTNGFGTLFAGTDYKYDMTLELDDGQKVDVKGLNAAKSGYPKYSSNWGSFYNVNRHKEGYVLKMLNDSTAYVGLTTFQLSEVQVEQIATFIDSVAAVPNMIIDVRNNNGGDVLVLDKLYSYIAGEPMTLYGYGKVNKQGGFECFKHSINYSSDMTPFGDYTAEQGRDGFYQREAAGRQIVPDSTINYKGRVYVLTNENSISAATLFPALLVRNHRGVVVGRETRTAYHFMNALKFAEIRLPNSMSVMRIPLVECVFDTVVNARVPYGRGVLPDYEVPLTLREINSQDGDAVLNHALDLIRQGKYLSADNPFDMSSDTKRSLLWGWFVVAGAVVLTVAMLVIKRVHRAKVA